MRGIKKKKNNHQENHISPPPWQQICREVVGLFASGLGWAKKYSDVGFPVGD